MNKLFKMWTGSKKVDSREKKGGNDTKLVLLVPLLCYYKVLEALFMSNIIFTKEQQEQLIKNSWVFQFQDVFNNELIFITQYS